MKVVKRYQLPVLKSVRGMQCAAWWLGSHTECTVCLKVAENRFQVLITHKKIVTVVRDGN